VVKEVERLKENREKRRAQQAQILEEKEALRNIDPGSATNTSVPNQSSEHLSSV
jgi:kinesin family protein 2/24